MILTAFHGFCMALADSVPGVSGGTIAFILGFYDRFINALHGLFRGNWKQRKAALTYLLKLGIGWGIGMVSCVVLLSSLLAACVTAFAGPISFVGIAVPHLVRQALGSARPLYVLPGCALGGATFCLLCDLIARSLFAPTELSISSVTAVFGAPVVIWLLVRRSQEGAR